LQEFYYNLLEVLQKKQLDQKDKNVEILMYSLGTVSKLINE